MQTGPKGLALIKEHEGLRLKAYRCPADVLTIGYGHTSRAGMPQVTKGLVISEAQAEVILKRDLGMFERSVAAAVTVPLTQNQFDALVSFTFNCGIGALQKSTLLKKLNAGRYEAVPAELMKWTRGGGKVLSGLVRRRREEAELWRSLDPTAIGGKSTVVKVDPPKPPKTMAMSKTGNTAIGVGTTGALLAASQAKEGTEALKGISDSLGVSVLVVIGIALVAAAAFIWWQRRTKLVEEQV